MAVHTTADKLTIERGGFPSIGPKVGLIQATINLGTLVTANDIADVFALPAGTLVLNMGLEVITAATDAATISFGLDGTGAGSRTEFSGELAVNGAVGTKLSGGYLKANVVLTDADIIVAEINVTPNNEDTQIRVWALVADINDMA